MAKRAKSKKAKPPAAPVPELPPIDSSPAYLAVFAKIEAWLDDEEKLPGDSFLGFLVEEHREGKSGMGVGKPVRYWLRDKNGLRQISRTERGELGRLNARVIYALPIVNFSIEPDGKRVHLGARFASRGGRGGVYFVRTRDDRPVLEPDPKGGFWIS